MDIMHSYGCESHDATDIFADMSHYDSQNLWNIIYERLQNKSALSCEDASCEAARATHNRWKNRYRDISPYDRNRVTIKTVSAGDYINASYVCLPDFKSRRYILTQGPMQQTVEHFWLMIWEHRSPAIIMLNKIFEKGTMRCHSYFPEQSGPLSLTFQNININVTLELESVGTNFIRRIFLLDNFETNEQHHVLHLHYTKWPDFGVPTSPGGMLDFLWSVRSSGCLDSPENPSVVHCSAGVGRSGAFVLIDLALLLVEQSGTLKGVDLADLFVKLRHCRMGVIQTADQLRFCYSAVLHAGQRLLDTPLQDRPFLRFDETPSEMSLSVFNNADGDSSSTHSSSVSEDFHFHVVSSSSDDGGEGADESGVEMVTLATLDDDDGDDEGPVGPECVVTQRSVLNPLSVDKMDDALGPSMQWSYPATSSSRSVNPSNAKFRTELFKYPAIALDRSNNAMDDLPSDTIAVHAPVLLQPASPHAPAVSSDIPLTESHDPAFDREQELADVASPPEDTQDLQAAYQQLLAASAELRDRRAARRLRHLRNIDRAQAAQQAFRAAGLERRRWLPDWLGGHLRWFYAESGLVHSAQGALVGSSFLLTVGLAVCFLAYTVLFK